MKSVLEFNEMRTSVTLQVLLFAAGAAALAQSPGSFSQTGQLTTVRTSHTATLLPTGKVLIAGGWAALAGWPVWSSAELYDPSAHTFALTGAMAVPRWGHAATLLPDGRVLITGGQSHYVSPVLSLASAELYDPSAGTFSPAGNMTTARAFHTAILLNNGKVLIGGGQGNGADGFFSNLSSAELYDPVTGSFTAIGSMVEARPVPVPTLLATGKVLIGGVGVGPAGSIDLASAELYDPAAGRFTLTGLLPYTNASRISGTLLPDGSVLGTFFDYASDGGFSDKTALYNASTGTFAPGAKMTTQRDSSTATLLPDGRVLIDGADDNEPYGFGGSAELYDPAGGSFTAAAAALPQSEEGQTATLLSDGTVLLAGGWIAGSSLASAEIYSPSVLTPSPVLYSAEGGAQGAIWNATTGQIASSQNPAAAGEILSMYTTSLFEGGAIPPQVAIGGQLAEVLYFGDAPGYPGYFQINFQVPAGVTPGSSVPVGLTYLGRSSNPVSIAVH
jgi:hypothetical protein